MKQNDAQTNATQGYAWLPPFAATIMFFCINAMLWSELFENETVHDNSTVKKARLFLFFALVVGFAGVIGAAFLTASFTRLTNAYQWAGVSVLVSTLLISFAAFLMRFLTLPPPRESTGIAPRS